MPGYYSPMANGSYNPQYMASGTQQAPQNGGVPMYLPNHGNPVLPPVNNPNAFPAGRQTYPIPVQLPHNYAAPGPQPVATSGQPPPVSHFPANQRPISQGKLIQQPFNQQVVGNNPGMNSNNFSARIGMRGPQVPQRVHYSSSVSNLNNQRLNANLDSDLPRPANPLYNNANGSISSFRNGGDNMRKMPSVASLNLNGSRNDPYGKPAMNSGIISQTRNEDRDVLPPLRMPSPTNLQSTIASPNSSALNNQMPTYQTQTPQIQFPTTPQVQSYSNSKTDSGEVPLPVRSQIQSSIANAKSTPLPSRPTSQRLYPTDNRLSGAPISPEASFNSNVSELSVNFAEPTPQKQRQNSSNTPSNNAEQLSIEQFEDIRRRASHQVHDPRIQLELAKSLCQAAEQLSMWYEDPTTIASGEVDPQTRAHNYEVWVTQALKIIKRLISKTQFPDAMFYLGTLYSSGSYGLVSDHIKAFELYEKASRLDHSDACYRAAVCCEFGIGTPSDFSKAVIWYRKAANLGCVASMYKLGILSLIGNLNLPRDFKAGFAWLQRAASKADRKNPHALHEIGLLFEHSPVGTFAPGDPLPKSDVKAFESYLAAAKLGYAPSQARIARCYEFGDLGIEICPEKSFSWYSEAAQAGDADAQLGLAGWYWTGFSNLKKNETEAFIWAERAAMKEHTRAQFAVGYFYEHGVGVQRDLENARLWYARAAHKKHPRAEQKLKDPLFS